MKRAKDFVDAHLRGCLPPGVPPSYRSIVSAEFVGRGRERRAVAGLVMFDGLPAQVSVRAWGIPGHRFVDLPGGDVSFEDGRWIRIDPVTLEPMPPPPPAPRRPADADHETRGNSNG